MKRELRLGNIIGWINRSHEVHIPITGLPQKVYRISIDECLTYPYELPEYQASDDKIHRIHSRDICGIPLTEEWLINFGFVLKKYSMLIPYWTNGRIELSQSLNFKCCYINRKINYVHELQNLYFATIGEELIIK